MEGCREEVLAKAKGECLSFTCSLLVPNLPFGSTPVNFLAIGAVYWYARRT